MIDYAAVNRYIGEDWDYRRNNCWHVFCRASREIFGNDIPNPQGFGSVYEDGVSEAIAREAAGPKWVRVEGPALKGGEAVVLGGVHIGLHVDNGMVLHCCKSRGTTYDSILLLGKIYKTVEFYRYIQCQE